MSRASEKISIIGDADQFNQIVQRGRATDAEQIQMFQRCDGNERLIESLLAWLVEDVGMPITSIIRSIKCKSGSAQPRNAAIQYARQGARNQLARAR